MALPSRRRIVVVLALLLLAGGAALPYAYPYIETARLWHDVTGVDVSAHQGAIDWPVLARSGAAFAYIKATEGGDFRDREFRSNWDEARKADMPRGAYHFFTQCRSGADQAQNFIAVVPKEAGALPAVLDAEHMGPCKHGPAVADVAREVEAFMTAVEAHYGRRPLIYTTEEFDTAYLRGRLTGDAFWVRNLYAPFLPPRFRKEQWVIWQYHNRGRRPGVNGPVDLNAFRGSRQEFAAFAASAPRP